MRLHDIIIGTGFKDMGDVCRVTLRAKENDRRRKTDATDFIEEVEAVDIGQARIEQNQMGMVFLDEF